MNSSISVAQWGLALKQPRKFNHFGFPLFKTDLPVRGLRVILDTGVVGERQISRDPLSLSGSFLPGALAT